MRIPFMKYYYSNQKSISGVIENFSRTFEKAKGLWLKAIAGDDLFYTDCYKIYENQTRKTCLETSVIIGKAKLFGHESKERCNPIPREKLASKTSIPLTNSKNIFSKVYLSRG